MSPMINQRRNEEIFADDRAGVTRTEIAKKFGLNQGSISRILRGLQSLGTYIQRERELYPLIKEAVQRYARRQGHKGLVDILGVRNGQDLIPDLAGFLTRRRAGRLYWDRVVIEVKAAPIRPRHIEKLEQYQRAYSAGYGFLISDKPIPPDIYDLELPDGIYLAYFDSEKKRLHWMEAPF